MKHLTHIILLSVVLSLFGCSDRRATSVLNHADSLLSTHPDTVLVMLDSLRAERSSDMSRRQKMRLELLRADAQNKAFVNFTTDSVMREVTAYYDAHGTAQERMRAHYLLGCTYRDMGDAPRALECYHDAIDKADTTSADCDYWLLTRIYGQIGDLYYNEFMLDNMRIAIAKSRYYALKIGKTKYATQLLEDMARIFYLENKLDSSSYYYKKAIHDFNVYGHEISAYRSMGALSGVLTEMNITDSVKKYMDLYEKYSGYFDEYGNIVSGKETYYYTKGNYYLNSNNYDSSSYYYNKVLRTGKTTSDTLSAYLGFLNIYKSKKIKDSIIKYTDVVNGFVIKEFKIKSARELQTIQSMYDYNKYKLIAQENVIKSTTLRYKLILSLILIIAIILLLLHVYFKRQQRIRELREDYRNSLRQKQQVHDEILKIKSQKYESLISDKEELIKMLNDKLERHSLTFAKEDLLNEELDSDEVVMRFREYVKRPIGDTLSSDDWKDLYEIIEQKIPGFRFYVNRDGNILSEKEYKICILVRLNFKPSDIGALLDLSSDNISNIRKRLLKKIFGEEGKPKDFDKLIKSAM